MRPLWLFLLLIALPLPGLAQQVVVGVEGDDRRGYAYVTTSQSTDLAPGRQMVLWATASYLYYDAITPGGVIRVHSPGVLGGIGHRWIQPRTTLLLGGGYETRWTRRDHPGGFEEQLTESGAHLVGDLLHRAAPRTTLHAGSSYSFANEWIFSRASIRQELLTATQRQPLAFRIGPEGGLHGNPDLRIRELGVVAEAGLAGVRGAIAVRAGQAWIDHRGAISERHPYFSIGYLQSF
jgi:hypothetical protein